VRDLRRGAWSVRDPDEVFTEAGRVFTGRFGPQPVEVLFDRICRENGISHRHTGVRSPTTTGKIERFHQSLRKEFLQDRTFNSVEAAQAALDAWVADYNTNRPHQALRDGHPSGPVPPHPGGQGRMR
jgi:transposase InsO family protein